MRRRARVAASVIAVTVGSGCGDDGRRTVRSAWDLAAPVAPSDRRVEVVIYVGSSTCTVDGDTKVEESADTVTLVASTRIKRGEGRDCTADLGTVREVHELRAPLGERRLLGCRPTGELSTTGAQPAQPLPAGEDCRSSLRP